MNTLLVLLFTLTTQAAPIPDAPDCDSHCSEPMRAIVQEFQSARTIDTENLPVVFSGECYHLTSQFDPDQAHHGFTLLETKDGEFYMGALFSFFSKENPYASLTIDEAREKSPRRFDNHHHLSVTENFAYADMNPENPDTPWKYWLKQNGDNLLLISQWGHFHQVYCRFPKNH